EDDHQASQDAEQDVRRAEVHDGPQRGCPVNVKRRTHPRPPPRSGEGEQEGRLAGIVGQASSLAPGPRTSEDACPTDRTELLTPLSPPLRFGEGVGVLASQRRRTTQMPPPRAATAIRTRASGSQTRPATWFGFTLSWRVNSDRSFSTF